MILGKLGKATPVAWAAGRKQNFAGPIVAMSMVPAFLRDVWQKGFQFPPRPSSLLGHQLFSTPYRAQLATTKAELKAAFQLRFRVFILELGEGLETSYRTLRDEMVELGRACIHPDHRKYEVLMLLWKAIVHYAVDHKARYMIGCSSLTSQETAYGSAVYSRLKASLVSEPLRTVPTPACSFDLEESDVDARPPKLLRTYLALGAKICGPPAFDREFKTIDFLTLMDLNNLTPAIRNRLLES